MCGREGQGGHAGRRHIDINSCGGKEEHLSDKVGYGYCADLPSTTTFISTLANRRISVDTGVELWRWVCQWRINVNSCGRKEEHLSDKVGYGYCADPPSTTACISTLTNRRIGVDTGIELKRWVCQWRANKIVTEEWRIVVDEKKMPGGGEIGDEWRQIRDGSMDGNVFGLPSFDEGDTVTKLLR